MFVYSDTMFRYEQRRLRPCSTLYSWYHPLVITSLLYKNRISLRVSSKIKSLRSDFKYRS